MEETLPERGWTGARTGWLRPGDGLAVAEGRGRRQTLLAAILVFAGYYLGAQIGFALTFKPHAVSVLWPPNSILLAALLLTPANGWWLVLLAVFPAHCLVELQSNVPSGMLFCWFVSNSVEALIGAGLIRYYLEGQISLGNLRNVAILCLFGVFLGPFLSSFLDSWFVILNHWGGDTYWEVWRIRFSSNALAALVITPLILAWADPAIALRRKLSGITFLEAGGLFAALFLLCLLIFNRLSPNADLALLYAPLPLLLWAAIRFNLRGATSAVAIVAFLAVWGATRGHGPFAENSIKQSALYVQLFVSFMSLPLLFLAALTEETNRTRETLQEREERIRLAAETAHLALWTIDFERGKSWMNDKGRSLFGFGRDEPLSREVFLSCVHPEDRDRVDEAIERARTESQTFEIEYRLQRPDGTTRWLISRGRYLSNSRGQVSELLGVAIDITGQVNANLELRSRQEELARLSRVTVMGELAASLAHELNQPLTAIASNAAAGKRFLASESIDPKGFAELLEDVFTDARRAGAVIHGIRQFVRKGEEIRVSLGINEVIGEVLRLLHSNLLSRSATVETRLASNLPAVRADPIHMQQVLINLVVNSIEAMEERPVGKRRVIISTEASGEWVQVAVRDFGIGLPTSDPDEIFAHFFSTKPNGMGMGLPIVRSIVEAHGGELRAENLGDGASVSFSLPVEGSSSQTFAV